MSRVTVALVAVVAALAGGLAVSLTTKPPLPTTDEAAVRAIVTDVLAQQTPAAAAPVDVASVDAAQINPLIESYLMDNPRLLERMSTALTAEIQAEKLAASTATIAKFQDAIFNDPDGIVVGNPEGDVTLVEMFDYNCGYCRQALPDLATLIAEDPNLRVVLKDFPILSQESFDAARVAMVVAQSDADYWTFHEALFSGRGQVTKDTAIAEAVKLGLSRPNIEMQMGTEPVSKAIQASYELAQALDISGTPTFIIGNELIPGAVPIEELRSRIANMRECGATICS